MDSRHHALRQRGLRARCAPVVRRAPVVAAFLATACASMPGRPTRPAALDGVWAADGYGMVYEVAADTLTPFEVTAVSCVRRDRYRATRAPAGARGAFTRLTGSETFEILPTASPTAARVHHDWAASERIIHRVARKPAVCDVPTPNTPLATFDVFAETWAEQYPFFADHGVDWRAVVRTARRGVTDTTAPQALFTILAGLIAPLEDGHSFLRARAIGRAFDVVRTSPSIITTRAESDSASALVSRYLTTSLHPFCNGRVEFGMLASDVGYLRIRSFESYTTDGGYQSGLAALEAALDTVFVHAGAWKGMVIDVRQNGGGADPYGIAIARRLTPVPYTAYAKQARSDPADASRWTPAQPTVVRPTPRPGFPGPVMELIGIQSISAAETFTQALMRRPRPVTRIGEHTQGLFSDVLVRQLPNGWAFGLPNERFVTDGRSYDITGIAPHVAVESFTPAARATGRDAAVERALAILNGREPLRGRTPPAR